MWGGAGEVTPPVHFRNFFVWFRPLVIAKLKLGNPRQSQCQSNNVRVVEGKIVLILRFAIPILKMRCHFQGNRNTTHEVLRFVLRVHCNNRTTGGVRAALM
jgi:hypothetical protein